MEYSSQDGFAAKKNIQNSAGTPTFLTLRMDLPPEEDSSYKSIVELISTCQQKQPATTSCSSVSLSLVVSNFLCLSITSLYLNSFTNKLLFFNGGRERSYKDYKCLFSKTPKGVARFFSNHEWKAPQNSVISL